MSGDTKVYNPKEVIISWGPVLLASGFGEDTFITIEQESDETEDVVGVDGEVTVSRIEDDRANIMFTLMQSSSGNDQLNVIANIGRNTPGMVGAIYPLLIKDLNGRALYTAPKAWISKRPSVEFGKVAKEREWTLRAGSLNRMDGGNN